MTTRTRARRGEGEKLREEIVAAATRLLVETGSIDAVSIRAIADAVGVTPPSIYLHFADKEDLILAVCDDRFQAMDQLMTEGAVTATTPLDELYKRGEAYIRFGLDNPEQYRFLMMSTGREMSPAKVSEWACLQHMVDSVQRCIDAGELPASDPFTVTLGLWAAAHGITSLMISKPNIPRPPFDTVVGHVHSRALFGVASPHPR